MVATGTGGKAEAENTKVRFIYLDQHDTGPSALETCILFIKQSVKELKVSAYSMLSGLMRTRWKSLVSGK